MDRSNGWSHGRGFKGVMNMTDEEVGGMNEVV